MCRVVWGEGWCGERPEKRNEEEGIRIDILYLSVLGVILKSALIHNKIEEQKKTTTNAFAKLRTRYFEAMYLFWPTKPVVNYTPLSVLIIITIMITSF